LRGIITHADVRIGQLVRPTDHLYHVVDPTTLWIVGDVLESDVRFLEKGQPLKATFTAIPEAAFPGHIDHLGLTMHRQSQTQRIVVTVNNQDGRLRAGMFGRVAISVQVAEQAIVCPRDAVVRVNLGQPIAHRLDHMVSGIRSQIAVKLYGPDMEELRDRGQAIAEVMTSVPGVVDLQIERQVDIPQIRVTIRRREAARYGLMPAKTARRFCIRRRSLSSVAS
jgi:hypothetical protein